MRHGSQPRRHGILKRKHLIGPLRHRRDQDKVQVCDDSSFSKPVMPAISFGQGPIQGQQAAPVFPHRVRRKRATDVYMAA